MASEKFEKYRKLLFENKPPGDVVKVDSMRRSMNAVGGRLIDGVRSEVADVGGVPGEWIIPDARSEEALPEEALPEEALPEEALPEEALPEEALPEEALPEEALPEEALPEEAAGAVVLYLHGGGYVAGSVDSHRNLLGHLAAAMGCRVFAADYRLAPEHPYPAAVDDAVAAYRGLIAEHDIDPGRIAVAGDSAGGGLTVAMLLALRDAGEVLPAAAIPISPWIDLEGRGASMTSRADADPMVTAGSLSIIGGMYLGDTPATDPIAAPINAELGGLPPMLIHVGDAEVLLDDSVRLADKIAAAGGEATLEVWPEMVHVWHAAAGFVPEADEAIARIAQFTRPHLSL